MNGGGKGEPQPKGPPAQSVGVPGPALHQHRTLMQPQSPAGLTTARTSCKIRSLFRGLGLYLFFKTLSFSEQLQVYRKIERKVQGFPVNPVPAHLHSSPLSTPPTRGVHLLHWTHHYHPESLVYPEAHSWGCTFHEFGQT